MAYGMTKGKTRIFGSSEGGSVETEYTNEAQIVTRAIAEYAKTARSMGMEQQYKDIMFALHVGLNALDIPKTEESRKPYIGIIEQ